MSDMADVLAEHEDCAFSASGILVCVCGVALEPQEVLEDLSNLAAHQAAMLTAAGFGPVREAQAEAWEEGVQAGHDGMIGKFHKNPYRARAVTVRGGE